MSSVAAIILAAGRSRRFGSGADETKLLASFDGMPLVRHVAMAAAASKARLIFAVIGHAHDSVKSALAGIDLGFVHNSDPSAGLSQSLRLGLDALPPDVSGAVVLLGDMPFVKAPLIDRLIAAFETAPIGTIAVVPAHRGEHGNPVLLGRALFAAAKQIEGDRGARALIDALEHGVIELIVEDESILIDIDTPEMMTSLRDRRRSRPEK